jgi:hypothetical protein
VLLFNTIKTPSACQVRNLEASKHELLTSKQDLVKEKDLLAEEVISLTETVSRRDRHLQTMHLELKVRWEYNNQTRGELS